MLLNRRTILKPERNYILLGPRRVGKSTFLKNVIENTTYIDLLKSDSYFEYSSHPALLRKRYSETTKTIIIDEVQRIPELLNEVHWMIENTKVRFVLSGASARKLRKNGLTNLAGRLRTQRMCTQRMCTQRMCPLTWKEIPKDTPLNRLLQFGTLPPILFSDEPKTDLKDYCGEYLKEEVQSEGLVRNLPSFTKFLEMAAFSNSELLNFATVARDCGVSAKTVAEYYQILEDTLLGYFVEPFAKTKKRRAVTTRKFYYFDCGVSNSLLGRIVSAKTPEYGKSFEQFLVLETIAASFYASKVEKIQFWRSANGHEVDLLLNENIAVEFKSGKVHEQDCAGILALSEDVSLKHKWIVSLDSEPRKFSNGVEVLPWQMYLEKLDDF
jgi:uncharacterized protein